MTTAATLTFCLSLAATGCDAPPSPGPRSDVTHSSSGTSAPGSRGTPAPGSSFAPTAAATATAAASASPTELDARARALAKEAVIVDGHVDLPYRMHESRTKDGKVSEDPSKRTKKGDFDFERAREGGLDAPFMSIYVPAKHQKEGGAKALADQLIDMVEGLISASPDKFAPGKSPADVLKASTEGKVALPMGIENGAALEGKLENVGHFHARGVRYITLTHSEDNDICDSSYSTAHTHKGLSAFGRQVVAEMNRLGIMVDVSHISDQAFEQVMDVTKTAVIASHSSCRHFTPGFERNMSDAMIERLAKNGGVIMINFGSGFLDADIRVAHEKLWDARKAFMKDNKLEDKDKKVNEFIDKYKAEHQIAFASVETVADHIDHAVKLVGMDHVGLGSDFDGVGDSLPTELKDVSQYPNLIRVLLQRGYREADIEKICSGNVLRVWTQVEQFAAKAK